MESSIRIIVTGCIEVRRLKERRLLIGQYAIRRLNTCDCYIHVSARSPEFIDHCAFVFGRDIEDRVGPQHIVDPHLCSRIRSHLELTFVVVPSRMAGALT